MNAGSINFFENLLGGKIWWNAAPVESDSAKRENDNELGEGEHFILAGDFRKLCGHKQDGNEDQSQGDDPANHHEEFLLQLRNGTWHRWRF